MMLHRRRLKSIVGGAAGICIGIALSVYLLFPDSQHVDDTLDGPRVLRTFFERIASADRFSLTHKKQGSSTSTGFERVATCHDVRVRRENYLAIKYISGTSGINICCDGRDVNVGVIPPMAKHALQKTLPSTPRHVKEYMNEDIVGKRAAFTAQNMSIVLYLMFEVDVWDAFTRDFELTGPYTVRNEGARQIVTLEARQKKYPNQIEIDIDTNGGGIVRIRWTSDDLPNYEVLEVFEDWSFEGDETPG